jgi:hypothetical protein
MASPNLAITHVAAAQNQKEVTINDGLNALDRALTDALVVDFTAGNVTLTDAQFRAAVAFAAANLSAARDLNGAADPPAVRGRQYRRLGNAQRQAR